MRVLLIAPYYDRNSTGEKWSTYKWVEGISANCDTTILTQHHQEWRSKDSPISSSQLVNWDDPSLPGLNSRLGWEVKPTYPLFYLRSRRWLRLAQKRGDTFDVIHQISPLALRYPCPARGLGMKYVIGPLAGSLPTPVGFPSAAKERIWYRKLRYLDHFRLRYDPWLTGSYSDASAVIGVAPYVQDLLRHCSIRKFVILAETGVDKVLNSQRTTGSSDSPLRLIFVGRLIHTKGILEAIESIYLARKSCNVTLDIFGEGVLSSECERLITSLGLADHVILHGSVPKTEVFTWYDKSDVFLFPSYREPSGNVVFEAMSRGLPVITSSVGGPSYLVNCKCGIRILPTNPKQYAADLSKAIILLANQPALLIRMSKEAILRISDLAVWPNKIHSLLSLYKSVSLSN